MSAPVPAYNWDDIPSREMRPGITARVFRADGCIVTWNTLTPELKPGPHRHPFDQVFMILKGRITLHIEDQAIECGPGSVVRIPPNALHWVDPPSEDVLNVDVFGPAREDYVPFARYQTDRFTDGT